MRVLIVEDDDELAELLDRPCGRPVMIPTDSITLAKPGPH